MASKNVYLIIIAAVAVIVVAGVAFLAFKPATPVQPSVAKVTLPTGEQIEVPTGLKGHVMLYTSIPQEITSGWQNDWNKFFSNYTQLEIYRAGTGTVVSKILAEEQAGGTKADVIYLAGIFDYLQLVDKGVIGNIPDVPELKSIPSQYIDPKGKYVIGRLLVMVIVYNPDLVKDPPKSWQDLLKPEWNGKIAIANPLVSGSMQYATLALVSQYGWDYFRKLKQNNPLLLQDVPDVARSVAQGERPVGVTLTMYLKTYTNLKYVIPQEGAIVIPSPLGIAKRSENSTDAVLLFRYLLTKQAATHLANAYTYGTRTDAPTPPGLPAISEIKSFPASIDSLKPYVPGLRGNWTSIFGG